MQIATVGLDLAKDVFQVHGVNGQHRARLAQGGSPGRCGCRSATVPSRDRRTVDERS
jgi:hypothetical protein